MSRNGHAAREIREETKKEKLKDRKKKKQKKKSDLLGKLQQKVESSIKVLCKLQVDSNNWISFWSRKIDFLLD
jgi:hypothetical protein